MSETIWRGDHVAVVEDGHTLRVCAVDPQTGDASSVGIRIGATGLSFKAKKSGHGRGTSLRWADFSDWDRDRAIRLAGALERLEKQARETLEELADRHAIEFSSAIVREQGGGTGADVIMIIRDPDTSAIRVLRALETPVMVETLDYLAAEYRKKL